MVTFPPSNVITGRVLSINILAPEVGVVVMTFPARSVPLEKEKDCVPGVLPTVQRNSYVLEEVLIISVTAIVFAPEPEICIIGFSLIDSLN